MLRTPLRFNKWQSGSGYAGVNAHVRVMRGSVRVFVCAARDADLLNAIRWLGAGSEGT